MSALTEKVTGKALHKAHFAVHLIEFAVISGAIIVAPNYRLMPEHTGHEILEDIDSICNWIKPNLQRLVTERLRHIQVDLSRIMVTGDSAGGYLALYASSKHADTLLPQAVYLRYPMVKEYSLPPAEVTVAQAREEVTRIIHEIDELQQSGALPSVTEATPPARSWTAIRMAVCGIWERRFGECERMREEIIKKRAVPRGGVWIVHGDKDDRVPISNTKEFIDFLDKIKPEVSVRFWIAPGKTHGYDHNIPLKELENREFLDEMRVAWLG